MSSCRRFLVSGRVQGVFFRASTRSQAEQRGLTGHAVNLPDGRVEVIACGEESALEALESWLHQGPAAAQVTDVQSQAIDIQPPSQFTTG